MNVTVSSLHLVTVIEYTSVQEEVSLASVDVDPPLKLLLNRTQLKPSESILELLPAVRALAQCVMYSITARNRDGFFQIIQRAGISYLHSTHRTSKYPTENSLNNKSSCL